MSPIIKTFNYNGSKITFELNGQVMVNATQMAKPFGKSTKDFLKTSPTAAFINALSERTKILSSDLVLVI